ncbi:MAG: hypothetical protein PQJ44_03150, partial [Sphaerochaetaceae bacterium]|nr:hypothetical protein [Sphaerochaetaceae bacterium]
YIKLIAIILISGAIIYINRSLFYFIMGNRNYMSKKSENKDKTWEYYRKAYNANLIDKYKVTMASILIQRNDHNFGGIILDSVINNSKDKNLVNHAKIQKSMVFQLNDEIDKSIEILEEVKNSGYNDKNLMINLGTYLLYTNDLEKAEALVNESVDEEKTSSGILDNHGWFYMLSDNWEEAYRIYLDVLDRKPRFPDPYVHAAQVFLHYRNVEKAIECLNEAIKKTWTNTIIFDKEMLTQMINNLESEKSNYFMACINLSVEEIAKGDLYKNLSEIEANNYLSKKAEAEPVQLIEEESENNEKNIEESTIESSVEVLDSELPNTELTEEDLKWEEDHK